ncbi:MAG TPA: IS200/IS605 family transposase [Bacteroidetes bacterium]|nr:IS200/IS605 family transposase [Bacteroidota bacterium]
MSQTFWKLWVHLVWGTKDSQPLLTNDLRPVLFEHIKGKARLEGYHLDAINGVADHIHCLISLAPRFSISEVANRLKGESSHWINAEKLTKSHFAWQGGFGAFSVSESQIGRIREYIANQEQHHAKQSYAEEVQEFITAYNAGRNESE